MTFVTVNGRRVAVAKKGEGYLPPEVAAAKLSEICEARGEEAVYEPRIGEWAEKLHVAESATR